MNKNHLLKMKLCGFLCLALSALAFTSCSQGADCDEAFSSDVRNAQLASPELTKANLATKITTSGDEVVQVSWEAVHGAGGYACKVEIVDDPENPEVVYENENLDGTSFTFPRKEDTKYEVSVRTLGNEKLNNKAAEEASVYAYSTLVPGQVVPAGTEDLAAWIREHMLDTDTEQAFELEAGATYELNSDIDFGDKQVTFRGDKINRPTVVLGENGVIRTSSGLKVKFINFDCTNQNPKGAANDIYGIIEMSLDPPAIRENTDESMKNYVLYETILLQECMFKNVHSCLYAVGKCSWAISDFRIDNCIVQLDNDGKAWSNGSVISAYSDFYYQGVSQGWYGGIKDMIIKNSTIYNIKKNSTNYFMRWNNKDLKRIFPTKLQDGSLTIENTTLSMVMTGKNWGDRTPNTKEYVVKFNNNVVYDCWRLQKIIQNNCTWDVDMTTNSVWGVTNSVDGTDKAKIATEEDPGFTEEQVTKELDLTQPNGGVNFKATGAISSTVGDPRWLN